MFCFCVIQVEGALTRAYHGTEIWSWISDIYHCSGEVLIYSASPGNLWWVLLVGASFVVVGPPCAFTRVIVYELLKYVFIALNSKLCNNWLFNEGYMAQFFCRILYSAIVRK